MKELPTKFQLTEIIELTLSELDKRLFKFSIPTKRKYAVLDRYDIGVGISFDQFFDIDEIALRSMEAPQIYDYLKEKYIEALKKVKTELNKALITVTGEVDLNEST